ncbi:MAG: hypothetical protein O3A92_07395 [Verrucomicrobia bacterium]|nr:hypothetical protein [Verrucomicrobiota bacterium]
MKTILTIVACSLSLSLSASAVSFDAEAFGSALNGWRKNRTASYSVDNHSYRTHRPTVTQTHGGGMFVSARVDHCPRGGKATSSYIELVFSGEGHLLSGQIRIKVGEKSLNTGQVVRAPEKPAPTEGEAEQDLEPWKTPTMQVVMDLFSALDSELGKLEKDDTKGKRDVFGRIFGQDFGSADLAAALRHNVNLMLGSAG